MDIAHKHELEQLSKEQVINICLEQEDTIRHHIEDNISLRQQLTERIFLADILLKVIKYQNGLND